MGIGAAIRNHNLVYLKINIDDKNTGRPTVYLILYTAHVITRILGQLLYYEDKKVCFLIESAIRPPGNNKNMRQFGVAHEI